MFLLYFIPNFPATASLLFLLTVAWAFVAIVQGSLVAFRESRHPNYTGILYMLIIGMLSWLAITMLLSNKGFFADFDAIPPKFPLLMMIPLIAIIWVVSRKSTTTLLMSIRPQALIWIQVFRIVVELVLWMLHREGFCPVQMTFEGWNFDILVGISAPIMAYFAYGGGRQNHRLALIWNYLGLALLLNIILTAVLSTPIFGVFHPENTFLAFWPMAWLPAFVAPFALFVHLLSIKQLRAKLKQG